MGLRNIAHRSFQRKEYSEKNRNLKLTNHIEKT